MRCVPPKVDSARPRIPQGTASIMKPCRANRKTVHVIPVATLATARIRRLGAAHVSTAAAAPTPDAATMARRSPTRAMTAPAGSEVTSCPSPRTEPMKAARATLAPRSRATRAKSGIEAP